MFNTVKQPQPATRHGRTMKTAFSNYAEFHVYERVAIMRDGRTVHFIGTVDATVIAAMTSAGVKIR